LCISNISASDKFCLETQVSLQGEHHGEELGLCPAMSPPQREKGAQGEQKQHWHQTTHSPHGAEQDQGPRESRNTTQSGAVPEGSKTWNRKSNPPH
jgi:hypothetical protein